MKNILLGLGLVGATVFAQPLQLDMTVFAERREALMKKLEPHSIAIFPCRPVYMRNLDVEYEYRQQSDFYYLSGFEEPESILLLSPSQPRNRYIVFVNKRNPHHTMYEGESAGVEGAIATYKADTAMYFTEFERALHLLAPRDGMLYYTFGINPKVDNIIKSNFLERRSDGDWPITDPEPLVAEMRVIKNDGDMRMGLQKAIEISAQAHREAMRSIVPAMYEYEVQAVFEYVYRKNGSPRNGYPCIVGSGPNSGILHYDKNTRQMKGGEVVLMDCAAEYGYYSADITRTVPVSGTFSNEQREIYQLVLDAQNAAMRIVKPGIAKSAIDVAIDSVLGNGLVRLGFVKDKRDFKIFSLHGYSHWIGLEVHDVGKYTINGASRMLEPGMVFTIEPGIYVREDVYEKMKQKGYSEKEIAGYKKKIAKYVNIGVRIEDDVLVTRDGFKNLSASAPREIEAVEALMKEKGLAKIYR